MKIRLEHKSVLLSRPVLGALVHYCWDPNSLGIVMEDLMDEKVKVFWSRLPDERCRRPLLYVEERLNIIELFQDIFQILKLFFNDMIENMLFIFLRFADVYKFINSLID